MFTGEGKEEKTVTMQPVDREAKRGDWQNNGEQTNFSFVGCLSAGSQSLTPLVRSVLHACSC